MSTRTGDVVIWRAAGTPICEVVVVQHDGEQLQDVGNRWETKASFLEAQTFARTRVQETKGRVLMWTGFGAPTLY